MYVARECPQEWIAELVWLNFMSVSIIKSNMWHWSCVMCVGFICYLCVQSKLRINTRSLFLIKHWSQRTGHCSAPVVGLEEYSAHDWRAASSVWRASVIWREWGLWSGYVSIPNFRPLPPLFSRKCPKTLTLTRFTKFFGLCDLEIWHMTLDATSSRYF